MKKNILLFTLAIGTLFANAQIEFRETSTGPSINGTTITANDVVTSTDVEKHLYVTQTSASNMDIRAKSYVLSMADGDYTICWFVCYAPQSNSTMFFNPSDVITVQPNQINDDFVGHYYPNVAGGPTTAKVRYVLYDNNNPADSAFVDILFDTNPTAVASITEKNVKLSAYPNPASDNLTIVYDVDGALNNASLEVYNVLGEEVISRTLNGNKGRVNLDLSSVNSGVYFYAVKAAGKTIRTERFIVR